MNKASGSESFPVFPASKEQQREGFQAGDVLGRCQLVAPIGQGSTGIVWEAWHTTLAFSVAVKVLRTSEDASHASRMLGRFRHEALLASRLDHAGFVRVLDYGEDHRRPYLVMELVRGPTLEEWMRSRGRVDQRTSLGIVGRICQALSALHRLGMVHRDIKPLNILVGPSGQLKISDLGLASFPRARGKEGPISGTLPYLAPECIREDHPVDARADLFAVGVILHRLLFGRFPQSAGGFAAGSGEEPVCDEGTLYLLRWLLEPDEQLRVQTAAEVARACCEQALWLERQGAMIG